MKCNSVYRFAKSEKNISATIYQFANDIPEHGKLFSDGDYIKEMCKKSLFEDFSNKTEIVKWLKQLQCSRNTVEESKTSGQIYLKSA
jgi:hypothetical protein